MRFHLEKLSQHKETIFLVPLQELAPLIKTNNLLQHEPPKMSWKLKPKFIPNAVPKILKF